LQLPPSDAAHSTPVIWNFGHRSIVLMPLLKLASISPPQLSSFSSWRRKYVWPSAGWRGKRRVDPATEYVPIYREGEIGLEWMGGGMPLSRSLAMYYRPVDGVVCDARDKHPGVN
jgi:hypothetical protein